MCNCACQRCLAGSCCLFQQPWTTTFGSTTTNSWPPPPPHEHDFAKFDRKRIFCRGCGEFKDAPE